MANAARVKHRPGPLRRAAGVTRTCCRGQSRATARLSADPSGSAGPNCAHARKCPARPCGWRLAPPASHRGQAHAGCGRDSTKRDAHVQTRRCAAPALRPTPLVPCHLNAVHVSGSCGPAPRRPARTAQQQRQRDADRRRGHVLQRIHRLLEKEWHLKAGVPCHTPPVREARQGSRVSPGGVRTWMFSSLPPSSRPMATTTRTRIPRWSLGHRCRASVLHVAGVRATLRAASAALAGRTAGWSLFGSRPTGAVKDRAWWMPAPTRREERGRHSCRSLQMALQPPCLARWT